MPSHEVLPWGRARHVFTWFVEREPNRSKPIDFTIAEIAHDIGRSRRYVQYALAELRAKGFLLPAPRKEVHP
jgi:CRP-like cAMP-binding protein